MCINCTADMVFRVPSNHDAYVARTDEEGDGIIRLSPHEASVNNREAFRQIYKSGRGEFKKDSFFSRLATAQPNVFLTTNVDIHRKKRKVMGPGVADSALVLYRSTINAKVKRALDQMAKDQRTRGACDVLHWWLALGSDTVSELSFGSSFNMLDAGKVRQVPTNLPCPSSVVPWIRLTRRRNTR
jgi:cytochrome P450